LAQEEKSFTGHRSAGYLMTGSEVTIMTWRRIETTKWVMRSQRNLTKHEAISYTSVFCLLLCIEATMSGLEFPWRFSLNVGSGFGFLHFVAVGCVTDLLLLSFT